MSDATLPDRIRRTRRRFLAGSAAGVAGLAGCGALDSSGGSTEQPVEAPSTLFASWRGGDPARTTTLQWIVETSEEPASLDVTLSDGGEDTAVQTTTTKFGLPASYPPTYRHRAAFDGLEPDTEYDVAIDGAATGLTVRTAPETVDEDLTFAEGGDIGTADVVPKLHQQAAGWDPLFALVGGDLAYANGRSLGKWRTFLETWHEHMRSDRRLIPLVAAIGNHETSSGMHDDPEDAPFFYQLFDNRQREHAYWVLDIGESVSIPILDSNHTTEVVGDQTDWLETVLAERTDREHLMPAYHVPAYPSAKPIEGGGRDRGDVREHWVPLFEEYDVDVCFEHDDHTYKRTHLLEGGEQSSEGVLYVGDGAWGKWPRPAKSPEERPYLKVSESELNVIEVTLSPDGSKEFEAVDEKGETIDSFDGNGAEL